MFLLGKFDNYFFLFLLAPAITAPTLNSSVNYTAALFKPKFDATKMYFTIVNSNPTCSKRLETNSSNAVFSNSPNNEKYQIWKWDSMYQNWTNLGTNNILESNSTGNLFTNYPVIGVPVIPDSQKWSTFNSSTVVFVNKASNKYLDMDASCKMRTSSSPTAFSNWILANGIVFFFFFNTFL